MNDLAFFYDANEYPIVDFLMTVDVECFDFATNSFEYDKIPKRVHEEGMLPLLDLFEKYGVSATFFFTGKFAQLSPESVEMASSRGHEIGCHGYSHFEFFDVMSLEHQVKNLKKSKKILEDICVCDVVSFRAPALRINKDTVRALEKTGFKIDSSVAPQRFDGPLTSGALKKVSWLFAERKPYHISYSSPFRSGVSTILEVPLSSMLWSLTGTHMRISPALTKLTHALLSKESRISGKPLVFLIHPNELISFERKNTEKRGSWFSDELRHRIKMKDLGANSLGLLEDVLTFGNYDFGTLKDFGAGI